MTSTLEVRRSMFDVQTVVWCLTDGKPGHRSQLDGLISQLGQRRDLRVEWIPVDRWGGGTFLRQWTRRRFDLGEKLPDPNLIIAAGHTTHLPALAARHARGGRAVVLMRPSLPTGLFDLCLIPEHDLHSGFGRLNRRGVVPTRGVINPIVAADNADARRALVLIGGPSQHHGWSNETLLDQLQEVIRISPANIEWTLTTSRRTPDSFANRLMSAALSGVTRRQVQIVPFEQTGPGWLSNQLSRVGTAFVTEDSVSMVYEALTSGADVGLLNVPRRRLSRIVRGIDRLIESRLVIPFEDWQTSRFETRRQETFNEAARCADIVCTQLLDAA